MARSLYWLSLLALVGCLLMPAANAEQAVPNTATTDMAGVNNAIMDSIRRGGQNAATRLMPITYGTGGGTTHFGQGSGGRPGVKTLFGALTGLMIVWIGLNMILDFGGGLDASIITIIRFALTLTFTIWLMDHYLPLMNTINDGFIYLADIILQQPTNTNGPLTLLNAGIGHIGNAIVSIWHSGPSLTTQDGGGGGWFSGISGFFHNLSHIKGDVQQFVLAFLIYGLLLIPVAILFATVVVFAGMVFLAQILTSIGIGIGPIMIPFIIVPLFADMFSGWMWFMISAGFYNLVVALSLNISDTALAELGRYAKNFEAHTTNLHAAFDTYLVAIMGMVLVSGIVLSLFSLVPLIVLHLLSGRGAIGTGFLAGMQGRTPRFNRSQSHDDGPPPPDTQTKTERTTTTTESEPAAETRVAAAGAAAAELERLPGPDSNPNPRPELPSPDPKPPETPRGSPGPNDEPPNAPNQSSGPTPERSNAPSAAPDMPDLSNIELREGTEIRAFDDNDIPLTDEEFKQQLDDLDRASENAEADSAKRATPDLDDSSKQEM